jgi:hypothetical protein
MAGLHYPAATGEFMAWFSTDADFLDYLVCLDYLVQRGVSSLTVGGGTMGHAGDASGAA